VAYFFGPPCIITMYKMA